VSTDIAERLRLLRRQAGAGAPAAPAPVPARATVEQLRRLLGLRGARGLQAPASAAGACELPGVEIAAGLRLVEEVLPLSPPHRPVVSDRPGFEALDPTRLLHFDTETTGLAGGTGTRAFMIGAADWQPRGLRVRQLLLSELRGEDAMLEVFASWLRPDSVLVSYNGRCFDAPLLATRYRLSRRPSPLAALAHLDLLFPVRRRFRGRWENCRLATVERQLLRVLREDDLPGSEAPGAWLAFLRRGDTGQLLRVLAHNRQDVISLALLAVRLSECEREVRQAL
jgi:uncharacterized protein